VNFLPAVPPPAGDYFPLTNNSWWSYDIGQPNAGDTVYNVIYGTKPYNSFTYTEMQDNYQAVPTDTAHYRKTGNDYIQWAPTDYYSATFAFDNPVYADILFLKENAAANTAWSSTFSGTVTGVAANLRYDFKIENPNTTLTVNSVTYTNVIYVSAAVKVSILAAPFTTIENDEYYYAKGIGLIKVVYKDALNGNALLGEGDLRHYKVF
jgi:hypothetical protein